VLVLLYPVAERPHLVLTIRGGGLPQHAGQVSLPGGAVEAGETIEDAALREAHEEVGVDPRALRVVGRLSPLEVPASGFVLHPVVALASTTPAWRPHPTEVAGILDVPVELLGDPRTVRTEVWERDGRPVVVPFFAVLGQRIWGATAMVLSELLELLGPDGGQ
jgi:8-oxo-dGTP pyrophosphatase MutT (NUDIX family)